MVKCCDDTYYDQVAPIAVYTSGKGSSAAGLTASVQRDTVSVSNISYFLLMKYLIHILLSARVLLRRWCDGVG